MITSRFIVLSLAMAGCTAAAFAIGRHTRQLEKRVHREGLRAWEDEGGHLAPRETETVVRPVAPA